MVSDELDAAKWLPGTEGLAEGPAEEKIDMGPLLRMLQSGIFCPARFALRVEYH